VVRILLRDWCAGTEIANSASQNHAAGAKQDWHSTCDTSTKAKQRCSKFPPGVAQSRFRCTKCPTLDTATLTLETTSSYFQGKQIDPSFIVWRSGFLCWDRCAALKSQSSVSSKVLDPAQDAPGRDCALTLNGETEVLKISPALRKLIYCTIFCRTH
jgi:hypothetical protein